MLLKYQDILDIGMRPHAGTGDRRGLPGKCNTLKAAGSRPWRSQGGALVHVAGLQEGGGTGKLTQSSKILDSSLVWEKYLCCWCFRQRVLIRHERAGSLWFNGIVFVFKHLWRRSRSTTPQVDPATVSVKNLVQFKNNI